MSIVWNSENQSICLHTQNMTYAMGVYQNKLLLHTYWGKRISAMPSVDQVISFKRGPAFFALDSWLSGADSSEAYQLEYGVEGGVDHRHPGVEIVIGNRSVIPQLQYQSHRIYQGKPMIPGLPATYVEKEEEAETVEVLLMDPQSQVSVTLVYSIYPQRDVLTRSVRIHNGGKETVTVKRALSMTVDFEESDFDILHLTGTWGRERHVERNPLTTGDTLYSSARGVSGHCENPFFALMSKNATENAGECYGFSLVYSGEFECGAEVNTLGNCRAYMGINPRHFSWELAPNADFCTPEVVMVYSQDGLGGMSRIYHKIYRTRLCRGKYRDISRPVLINNWEATYFDFNEEKILSIAEAAKKIGVELMVLDDGWFGKRDNDQSSLGDWVVDRNKLPDGLSSLAEKIEGMGMKFGLWFEPEMISPVSDLCKEHPDWHIHIPGYEASYGRSQWVLDLSRKDVQDYLIHALSEVLHSAPISYVKWDFNRNMAELGSAELPATKNGELCHRFILGLYRIMETLYQEFPDILFESCSGGGGRFDAGMLYYMPQTWTSDNSDAAERIYIQYGTSVVYPTSTMGAHVSAVPNHQLGRTTPLKLRGDVAMMGQFGFELDLNKLTEEELTEAAEMIVAYKKYRDIFHHGEMYRLVSPFEGNNAAFNFVSEDQSRAILCVYCLRGKAMGIRFRVRMEGLDPSAIYRNCDTGEEYAGDYLMQKGLLWSPLRDYLSQVTYFEKVR